MERAPRQMCAAIFKKKNVVGEKASKSAYDLLYPPILKLYINPLNISLLWKTWFCCSVTHAQYAQTCIADTISIKISCARSIFFFFFFFFLKTVLSHAMLPSEGSRLDDPNQNTHRRMSAHHEDPQWFYLAIFEAVYGSHSQSKNGLYFPNFMYFSSYLPNFDKIFSQMCRKR